MFFLSYLITPKTCHRFVGYLEEEAVMTYSQCLKDIDEGLLDDLKDIQVPDIALAYWNMEPSATFKDLILYIRADESKHREVNHTFANIEKNDRNPFALQVDSDKPQPDYGLKLHKGTGWEKKDLILTAESK